MLYTFELYEGKHFVGTKTIEADSELLATVDLDCELEDEGRSHLEYDLLEPCTGCENGCDQCLDPLMAGYAGCYHKDSEKCNCAEEYRLHQKWVYEF